MYKTSTQTVSRMQDGANIFFLLYKGKTPRKVLQNKSMMEIQFIKCAQSQLLHLNNNFFVKICKNILFYKEDFCRGRL